MCRLASPANLRLRQARELEVTYAGAEASVAASVCNFGGVARYVTALPRHALAEATMDTLRAVGIGNDGREAPDTISACHQIQPKHHHSLVFSGADSD